MRARLIVLLTVLSASALFALGVPLGATIRASYTHDMVIDRLDDTTRLAGAAALADANGRLESVLGELDRYRSIYGIGALVLDGVGRVRLSSADSSLPEDAESARRVSDALGGRRTDHVPAQWPWDPHPMVVAVPITRGGDVVGVMVTVSPTDRLSHRVLVQWAVLGAVGCALLVACAFAADRLARWVLRPVQVLARATDEVATGRLAARVAAAAGPPELRRLATSFNTMADYVQSASEHQRAFVADASHQLRNPLAALLIRLDDVADRAGPGLENDARRAMDEGKRLAGILERLLELARSEQSAAEIATQPVEPVVAERVSAWSPIARSRRISMHVEHQPGLRASMDAIAVAGALDVLLDNALKFSPESSRITVTTARTAGQVVISVRDEGPGLTPDELPRAGDRFWRSRTQQNVAGYGLGLSIARALLEPGQGRLEIVAPERGGLDVRLVLPAVTASNAGTS